MKMIDLFAGLGVASLAAEKVWSEVDHEMVEIDPYCQTILKKHFPKAKIHNDIRNYHYTGEPVDLVWGSPPCQAASSAGKRKGTDDTRWLWPDTFRVIEEAQPKYWVLENVRGLLSLEGGVVFDSLLAEMEKLGYEVGVYIVPACAVGAVHRRDRIWIVGKREREVLPDSSGEGLERCKHEKYNHSEPYEISSDTNNSRLERMQEAGNFEGGRKITEQRSGIKSFGWNESTPDWTTDWRDVAASTCFRGMANGTSKRFHRLTDGTRISGPRLRKERLKALGNSLVLQNVIKIFEAIKYAELP